jgi:GDP-L-fucose synthase
MKLEGQNILVTGASGLIGSSLIQKLREIPNAKVQGTLHVSPPKSRGTYVVGDLLDPRFCEEATRGRDVVFHCAANSYGAAIMDSDPMALVRGNIPMNINMLDACHKNGVKKFVWLASTTGYPETTEAVTEDMMFQGEPFEKYYAVGWVKRYTEVLCKLFAEKLKNKMPCVILRPTNIYGPNDKLDPKKSHVLSALMRKVIIKQNPIEVWGDGTDEKDVLYVDDMVEAMILAAEKVEQFDQFNIGYRDTFTVLQILDMIKEVANYEAPYKLIPSGPRMIPIRRVSTEKAERVLGWKPKVNIKEGLRRMYDWMVNELKEEK